jgi:hypothetical protein
MLLNTQKNSINKFTQHYLSKNFISDKDFEEFDSLDNQIKNSPVGINNLIIDNVSYYVSNQMDENLITFLQTRQSGSNSCYSSVFKDMIRSIEYIKDFIENPTVKWDKYKLSIKDLMMIGNIQISEQNFNEAELLLRYNYNIQQSKNTNNDLFFLSQLQILSQ